MIAEIAKTVPKAFVVISLSKKRPSSFDLQKSPTTTKTPNVHGKKAKAKETDTEATRLVLEAQDCLVQAAALYGKQLVGDEKHLYVVPATNLRCLHLRAKFSHGGAGLGGVVCIKGL
jgi:hypothetical protein